MMHVQLEERYQSLTEEVWRDCPRVPNAVATNHPSPNRRMLPLKYNGLLTEAAREALVQTISDLPGSKIIKTEKRYLCVRFRTALFHFSHESEFYLDDEKKQILCRARSRIGFADFGMNKRWLQTVYARFLKIIDEYQKQE
ncbi:DUF1499 domain-containing protein [Sporolactobacillus sp. THM7-7]|nr:DUF1499 domain-containing protein [Sporolactobacillus sp. THM7-7]